MYLLWIFRLSPAVGALYVRKYFNDDKTKNHAIEIVENIRSSFVEMLQKVSWMDEKTKNAAIDKATKLVAHIAYPKELTNNTKLEEHYGSLEMKDDEYLMNALRLNKFKSEYALRELFKPVDKNNWLQHATPAMTNAFYSALENSIRKSFYESKNSTNKAYITFTNTQSSQRAFSKENFYPSTDRIT